MKYKLLFLITLFLISLNTTAQKVKLGIKAGANVAMLTGDVNIMTSVYGVHAGGFIEFRALGKVAIQPEILFSTQGAKNEITSNPIIGTEVKSISNIHLNYVNMPLMLKYFVSKGLFIEAGPQASILLSAIDKQKTTITTATLTINDATESDLKKSLNNVDWAANIGIGYDFLNKVFIQSRYSLGVTNIYKNNDINVKNGVFQLSVGYKF